MQLQCRSLGVLFTCGSSVLCFQCRTVSVPCGSLSTDLLPFSSYTARLLQLLCCTDTSQHTSSAVPFPCRTVSIPCGFLYSAVRPQLSSPTSVITYSSPTARFLQSLLGCSLNVQFRHQAVSLCSTIPLHCFCATAQFPHRQPSSS